jgi:hypothetical protein
MYNGFFFHFKTDQQAKCISCHKKLISEIINKSYCEGNFLNYFFLNLQTNQNPSWVAAVFFFLLKQL